MEYKPVLSPASMGGCAAQRLQTHILTSPLQMQKSPLKEPKITVSKVFAKQEGMKRRDMGGN